MSVPGARSSINDFNNFFSFLLPTWPVGERKHDCKSHGVQRQSSLRLSVTQWVRDIVLRRRKLLAVSLAILAAIVAVWLIGESLLYERTDDARIDGKIMPLSASINGYAQQVNVIEGQMVHAGDVLAVLDQKEYSIAVYQAIANLDYAVNTAASLYYSAAITVNTAYGDLNTAQSEVKSAQAEVAATKDKLRADEAVLKQVQANEAQLTIVQAVVAADQQVLLETQKELVQAASHLSDAQTAPLLVSLAKVKAQAADSRVLQCKAQLEQAQLNLSNTIIRSPAIGIVGKRRIEVGQNVKIGQELIDIVSLDDVWITANFRLSQLVHLRPGEPVEIKVDAYDRTWKGHVTNLGGGASSVIRAMPLRGAIVNDVKGMPQVPVRIDFDRPEHQNFNSEDLLKPGLSVEPSVRVRWLPRTGAPSTAADGRGSSAERSVPNPQLDSDGGSDGIDHFGNLGKPAMAVAWIFSLLYGRHL
jgi:membrane fusion protein (multidrug efflux system)